MGKRNLTRKPLCRLNSFISSLHLTIMFMSSPQMRLCSWVRCLTSNLRQFRDILHDSKLCRYLKWSKPNFFLRILANMLAIFSSRGRRYRFRRNIWFNYLLIDICSRSTRFTGSVTDKTFKYKRKRIFQMSKFFMLGYSLNLMINEINVALGNKVTRGKRNFRKNPQDFKLNFSNLNRVLYSKRILNLIFFIYVYSMHLSIEILIIVIRLRPYL